MRKNIDYIECALCGLKAKRITISHLWNVHKITIEEYKKQCPECPLTCRKLLTQIKKSAVTRHKVKPFTKATKEKISRTLRKHYKKP